MRQSTTKSYNNTLLNKSSRHIVFCLLFFFFCIGVLERVPYYLMSWVGWPRWQTMSHTREPFGRKKIDNARMRISVLVLPYWPIHFNTHSLQTIFHGLIEAVELHQQISTLLWTISLQQIDLTLEIL